METSRGEDDGPMEDKRPVVRGAGERDDSGRAGLRTAGDDSVSVEGGAVMVTAI